MVNPFSPKSLTYIRQKEHRVLVKDKLRPIPSPEKPARIITTDKKRETPHLVGENR